MPSKTTAQSALKKQPYHEMKPFHFELQETESVQDAWISKLLLNKSKNRAQLMNSVRKGLPVSAFTRVQHKLGDEKIFKWLLTYIGASESTLFRMKQANRLFNPIQSDRLLRIARIQSLARDVFDDEKTAINWLTAQNRALGDTPLNLLDTETGTDEVERVLYRIEYGVYS
ncbi:MAG TPA: DUF2384 domain-containing protein [Gammaproteobacteria bacterium]|nr:DUF2384 domain-containing protein [Gammaproteobacteria bacterium]